MSEAICQGRVMGEWMSKQCTYKAKYDADENGVFTKCKIHCEETRLQKKKKHKDEMDAYYDKINRNKQTQKATQAAIAAIKLIAEGHNDPRSLAKEVVAQFPSPPTDKE